MDKDNFINSLSKMVQHETISIEGEENIDKFKSFHILLKNLFPLVHSNLEIVNIDGNLLYKWEGKSKEKLPILLMNHMDTAPINGKWKYDGLSGVIKEGYIWGRGTLDTKGPLCAIFSALEELLEEGYKPYRDIYLASSRNEEIAGDGAPKIVEYLKSKNICFETLLDEGGAILDKPLPLLKKKFALIGVGEKGHVILDFYTEDNVSLKDNFKYIKKYLEEDSPFKGKINDVVRDMFLETSKEMKMPLSFIFKNSKKLEKVLIKVLSKVSKEAGSIIKSTCSVKFNEKENKIRVVIKVSKEDGLDYSINLVKNIGEKYKLKSKILYKYPPSEIYSMNSKGFKKVKESLKTVYKDVGVAPYLMIAGTDARHYDSISKCSLRFAPLDLKMEDLKRVHNVNERLEVKNFYKMIDFYKNFIKGYDN
ncbi:carboxypeptidase PM20D1 [Clostridium moniliforme]|uniref:Carboxypeptidase PM20D1 n=1 Tax=Clostridium moniliforme TaxID=39489 RepID=A0ABS4EXF9_9CLOT|nr:M20/M25/M40 family metallo-hydrolase [Clostridium moniliforme]MBP1888682.1 carboxypeptidase PM20D1 [Clostridium moniliforme]